MSLCALYESIIYWQINHVSVCEDYAFFKLWSIWQHLSSVWKDEAFAPNISRMGQYDLKSCHGMVVQKGFFYIPLNADKNKFCVWGWTSLKQIGFWGHWGILGAAPCEFQNFKGPYIVLYKWLPTINGIFSN